MWSDGLLFAGEVAALKYQYQSQKLLVAPASQLQPTETLFGRATE